MDDEKEEPKNEMNFPEWFKRNENHIDAIDLMLFVWLDALCVCVCACLDPYGLAGGRSHFYCHKNEIYDRPRMQLHNLCDDGTNKQTGSSSSTTESTYIIKKLI